MTDKELIVWLWAVAAISVFAIFSARPVPIEPPLLNLTPVPELMYLEPFVVEVPKRQVSATVCNSCHARLNDDLFETRKLRSP